MLCTAASVNEFLLLIKSVSYVVTILVADIILTAASIAALISHSIIPPTKAISVTLKNRSDHVTAGSRQLEAAGRQFADGASEQALSARRKIIKTIDNCRRQHSGVEAMFSKDWRI